MLFTGLGRAVVGKTVPSVSVSVSVSVSEAVLETEGTVFRNTARPKPVNNIFIYF